MSNWEETWGGPRTDSRDHVSWLAQEQIENLHEEVTVERVVWASLLTLLAKCATEVKLWFTDRSIDQSKLASSTGRLLRVTLQRQVSVLCSGLIRLLSHQSSFWAKLSNHKAPIRLFNLRWLLRQQQGGDNTVDGKTGKVAVNSTTVRDRSYRAEGEPSQELSPMNEQRPLLAPPPSVLWRYTQNLQADPFPGSSSDSLWEIAFDNGSLCRLRNVFHFFIRRSSKSRPWGAGKKQRKEKGNEGRRKRRRVLWRKPLDGEDGKFGECGPIFKSSCHATDE